MIEKIHFAGNKKNPYHLSVGIILWQDKQIALIKKPDGYITLPQETLYSDESIEEAIGRGLAKEVGTSDTRVETVL